MSELKLVAFDLDGTLADTLPMSIAAFEQAVSPYAGHRLSEAEITETFGLNETGMVKAVVKDCWEQALEDYYQAYQTMHDRCTAPYEGIIPLLEALKTKGLIVALVTGKSEKSCRISLEALGLAGMFSDVLTGSEYGNRKKDRLISLMDKYGLSPEECVYVGDTVSDAAACKAAGVPCFSAAWCGFTHPDALERANPGRVCGSVEELRQKLEV